MQLRAVWKTAIWKTTSSTTRYFRSSSPSLRPTTSTNTSACLRWTRRQQPAIWLRLRFRGCRLRWLLRRHYVIGLVHFAHLSAGTSFLFNFSPSRNVPRYKNDTNRDSVMAPTSADRCWWCMDVNADLVANCISRFLFFPNSMARNAQINAIQ